MNYLGTIIEESLQDQSVFNRLATIRTKVEPVTERHRTPWLRQWTIRTVEVPERSATEIARAVSQAIDGGHASSWYVDFKNDVQHYIIFRNRVFLIDRKKPYEYAAVTAYGVGRGIPEHQLDFSPAILPNASVAS